MKKKRQITLIMGDQKETFNYKTTNRLNTSLLTLIIDLVAIIFFDWWIWIPTFILTTIFASNKYTEMENLKRNVDLLIGKGFAAETEHDAALLYADFALHESLISGYKFNNTKNKIVAIKTSN